MHYHVTHIARKCRLLASICSTATGGMAHAMMYDITIQPDTLDRLDGCLDNLMVTATNDHTMLSQLIDSNASLVASVATLTSSLVALSAMYTAILASGNRAPAPAATPAAACPPRNRKLAPNGYCWTHGSQVSTCHNSLSCSNKATGHKDTTTHADMMEGSNANKGWECNST
jgi:hypothetical protein